MLGRAGNLQLKVDTRFGRQFFDDRNRTNIPKVPGDDSGELVQYTERTLGGYQ